MTDIERVNQAIVNITIHAQCSNPPSPNDMEVLRRFALQGAQLQSQIAELQSRLTTQVEAHKKTLWALRHCVPALNITAYEREATEAIDAAMQKGKE